MGIRNSDAISIPVSLGTTECYQCAEKFLALAIVMGAQTDIELSQRALGRFAGRKAERYVEQKGAGTENVCHSLNRTED